MKTLIVYDSTYGNTEKIARAIGDGLGGETRVVQATRASPADLDSVSFLVIGSPTQGGRPTPAVLEFLDRLPDGAVKRVKAAAFDTRFSTRWVGIFGYAAEKIARSLKAKGGTLVLPPEAFFVKGKEGPLREGEEERAAAWVRGIAE